MQTINDRIVTYASRDEMIADRPRSVGASETAVILGIETELEIGKFSSPYALYCQKKGIVAQPDLSDDELVESGIFYEDGTIRRYDHRRRKKDKTFLRAEAWEQCKRVRHAKYPFWLCTPDALQYFAGEDKPRLLQVKNVSEWQRSAWQDDAPLPYQVQIMAELAITGLDHATVAASIGGTSLVWFDYTRNNEFIDKMTGSVVEFWDMLQNDIPPAVDGSIWTADSLAQRFKRVDKHKVAVLPWELMAVADELEKVKAENAARDKQQRKLENALKEAIGNNEAGLLTDGRTITWTPDSRGFRTLRIKRK